MATATQYEWHTTIYEQNAVSKNIKYKVRKHTSLEFAIFQLFAPLASIQNSIYHMEKYFRPLVLVT